MRIILETCSTIGQISGVLLPIPIMLILNVFSCQIPVNNGLLLQLRPRQFVCVLGGTHKLHMPYKARNDKGDGGVGWNVSWHWKWKQLTCLNIT